MKDITKKGYKVRKRIEQKRPNKQVLAYWINSLSKELDNSCKKVGAEAGYVVLIEAKSVGIPSEGVVCMDGSSIDELGAIDNVITPASGNLALSQ